MEGLSKKQMRFCEEYLTDFDAERAAARVGYSEKTGGRLLKNPEISKYIGLHVKDIEERAKVSQNEVIRELSYIAFSNASDFVRVKNDLDGEKVIETINTDELLPQQKAAVNSITRDKYGVKVTTYDKLKALELLGKHMGMFKEKSGTGNDEPVKILDDIPGEDTL